MVHVLGCVFQQHDLRLVAAALALCLFACATALSMIARGRAARSLQLRWAWIVGAGAVAGSGIWATHFVAMLAYSIALPFAFNTGLTILSATIAIAFCALGFAVATSRLGAVAGGLVTGLAVCAMHYIGMMAIDLPAYAIWDVHYVASSILLGTSLCALAMYFAFRYRGYWGHVFGTASFALAIVSMHFTGMSAVHFVPDASIIVHGSIIDPLTLAVVIMASAAFIVSQGLMVAIIDSHLSARTVAESVRMRSHIAELENTKNALSQALTAEADASLAKSAFLASMSHELRTPLNAIIGFSEMMMAGIFGPISARYQEYTKDIHSSGKHLLSLINDVLDLSRLDAGQGDLYDEMFDLPGLIADSLRLVTTQAAKAQVKISTDHGPALPLVRADKRRLRQIILNLVSNALKFTPAGGRVLIQTALAEQGIAITISDTGIGINAEDIPRAFEQFGQVDSSLARKYEGTGLGLPLARRLTELHGGTLNLESTPNVGTTVTVILPLGRLALEQSKIVAA